MVVLWLFLVFFFYVFFFFSRARGNFMLFGSVFSGSSGDGFSLP